MSYTIVLSESMKHAMIDHAKTALPNECCGYITGIDDQCKTIHKMTNINPSPTYFEFDPKEQFDVVKIARKAGEVPLVVYHSHPSSPARLSKKDLELLRDPDITYIIVSLANNAEEVKGYRIINDVIFDVELQIKGG
jgi:proteasome lid subunit RPN8/RPN11